MAKIVVFSLRNWWIHQVWERTIAKHLELNGHEVINILYQKPFGGDDLKSYGQYDHIHSHISVKTGQETARMFQPKELYEIEDYFTQQDLQNALNILGKAEYPELKTLEYKGIQVGDLCRTSTVRTTHSTDESGELYQRVFRDNVSTSIYLIDAFERILLNHKPNAVFCMNGIFFAERILVDMCVKLKIKVVTYERAARPDNLYITTNEPINLFNFNNEYEKHKSIDLSVEELEEITSYLNDRRTSKNTTQKFQDSDTDDREQTKKSIGYDGIKSTNKQIVSMFTNVMWDTAAVDKDTIFDNVLDWCVKTIQYAEKNKNIELFIRIHPADARYWGFAGAKQLQDEIIKVVPVLPNNVHLIKSQDKINSYCLAELSDKCIVYTSQIGAEIAAMGRPLIIAGEAFYRNKGFGYVPNNQDEYYYLISDEMLLPNKEHQKEALKYEHFLYFKQHYPFRLIKEDANKGMGVVSNMSFLKDNGDGTMDLNLGTIKNDEDCKRIANYILEGIKNEFDVEMYEVI